MQVYAPGYDTPTNDFVPPIIEEGIQVVTKRLKSKIRRANEAATCNNLVALGNYGDNGNIITFIWRGWR